MYRECQEHDGAVDANSLFVQYNDEDGASGGVAKYVRLDEVVYPDGNRTVDYDYGTAGAIDDIMSRLASIGDGTDTYASYRYLGMGRIVEEDYEDVEVKLSYLESNGNVSGLDRFGRVADQVWTDYGAEPDVVLDRYTYTYDRAGNRTSRDNELHSAFDEDYTYDALDRLTDSARADSFDQSWGLDGLGNFGTFDDDGTSQSRTTNAANEITGITGTWIDPTYDNGGNMISGPKTGNETGRVHYIYDAWNRLVEVRVDDSGEPGDLVAEYEYDGANRRVAKVVGGTSHAHYYFNQEWQLLEEDFVDAQGASVASNQYAWSTRYIDAPIVRFHDGNGDGDLLDAGDNTRYYTSDANYNVTSTIDAATGEVVERYVYTAYGQATVYDETWANPTAPATDGPLYCGYFFDAETALYQVRNRYYNSSLSAFISRDPIGFQGRDSNLYRYVAGNPEGATDPSGLSILTYIPILGTIECFLTTYAGTSVGDYDSILTGGFAPSEEECCSSEPADKEKAITECQNAVKQVASGYILDVGLAYGVHIFSDVVGIIAGIAIGGPIGIVVGGVAAIDGVAAGWCVVDAARDITAMADFVEANVCIC